MSLKRNWWSSFPTVPASIKPHVLPPWIRINADGPTVQASARILVQGPQADIDRFLQAVLFAGVRIRRQRQGDGLRRESLERDCGVAVVRDGAGHTLRASSGQGVVAASALGRRAAKREDHAGRCR